MKMEEIILIVAIVFVCAIIVAGFIMSVIACHDAAKARRTYKQLVEEKPQTLEEEPKKNEEKRPESKNDEKETVSEMAKPDGDVNFSPDKLTLEEKYLKLPAETRAYYDEVVRYAMAVEGNKRFKKATYEEYKLGKSSIVKIRIKNDVIICELLIPNFDFKNYVSDNKIDVRHSATVIRVVDDASVDAVKGSIDIVLKELGKEREYKKERANQRRRERRAMAKVSKVENAEVAASDDSVNGEPKHNA